MGEKDSVQSCDLTNVFWFLVMATDAELFAAAHYFFAYTGLV